MQPLRDALIFTRLTEARKKLLVKLYLLALSMQHFHEQGLGRSLAGAVPLVKVLLAPRCECVDLRYHHH